ncbi:MAG TPA: DUF6048 family protein [Chryseolinea sp.]|jgi:hypothetical protein|nr:DUF6048 family protein [Chryseolinea sp.]
MSKLRLINISLLLLSSTLAFSQKSDSVRADSVVRPSFIPTGIRVGTDLISLFKTQFQDDFSAWEVNADVDFHRYYLAIDYGGGSRTFRSDSGNYSNDGTYWRVGVDVNFLLKDPDRNMFFFGARYGQATFSQDLTVYAKNLVTHDFENLAYHDGSVNAHWYELTTGLRVKIWKMIWLGYTARFKFGLSMDETEHIIASDVPGYGRTYKDSAWGFNYQIFIRIPVRKQPPLAFKTKKK